MRTVFFIMTALFTLSYSFVPSSGLESCKQSIISSLNKLQNNVNSGKEAMVEGIVEFSQNLPTVLKDCGMDQLSEKVDAQLSSDCLLDLSKGIDILLRMLNQTDNKARFALDLALLQRLYEHKIQTECKFLNEVSFNFKSNATCLESAYQLSLTVQTLWQDLVKGNSSAALKELQVFLDDLPDTLDACGQSKWATKIRKDFPASCLQSFDDLGKQLIVFEHNYDHLQWVFSHWKDLQKVLVQVKKTCPLFA